MADPDKEASSSMSLTREDLELLCFRNLLATPGERLFFKDLQSRFLLVSESLAGDQSHGFGVEELIGKTDFDVFSDEHALAAYEDEQRIIQTGKPMVGKIERETFHDRDDAWVSTTKLPLRDVTGGSWAPSASRVTSPHRSWPSRPSPTRLSTTPSQGWLTGWRSWTACRRPWSPSTGPTAG